MNKKSYPLEIDPAILELLGPSLYTNLYYVLAELIANAWDADAKNVWIDVNNKILAVEDDGRGMSYQREEVQRFLNVAKSTRTNKLEAKTPNFHRARMGRKGIGKLASLAVSQNVRVMTISGQEKSGFILTREVPKNGALAAIPESKISLEHVKNESGTRIEMINPEYSLPKRIGTMTNNLVKFFPQISDDFKIHINMNGKEEMVGSYADVVLGNLDSLTTFGKAYDTFGSNDRKLKDTDFVVRNAEFVKSLNLINRDGDSITRDLVIQGWIGSYETTRGQKKIQASDFPENFVAVYSHEKMGQFNILSQVGSNRLNEVYLVGQIYVDLFEDTDLPDMSLSNRQGYKTDDPRYIAFLEWATQAIKDATILKGKANTNKKKNKQVTGLKKKKEKEKQLTHTVDKALLKISQITKEQEGNKISEEAVSDLKNILVDVGTKSFDISENEKKILISQTKTDQEVNEVIYEMFKYNGFKPQDIIYSNSMDPEAALPDNTDIYDYLRNFFVQTLARKNIFVIYMDSDNTAKSHGVVIEQGAGWVVKTDHAIIKVGKHNPEPPLCTTVKYAEINCRKREVFCDDSNFNTLYGIISRACNLFNKKPKSLADNKQRFMEMADILPVQEYITKLDD